MQRVFNNQLMKLAIKLRCSKQGGHGQWKTPGKTRGLEESILLRKTTDMPKKPK